MQHSNGRSFGPKPNYTDAEYETIIGQYDFQLRLVKCSIKYFIKLLEEAKNNDNQAHESIKSKLEEAKTKKEKLLNEKQRISKKFYAQF